MKASILLLFIILPSIVFSQQRKIDSLDRLISKSTSDTQIINLINEKTKLVQQVNLDTAIAMVAANLQHAIDIHYTKGEADARVKSALNFCYKGEFDKAETQLKLANQSYTATNDSIGFLNLYSNYGIFYGMQSQYEKSIGYFQKAAAIAENTNNLPKATSIYQNIATSYQMKSDYANALTFYQKALKLAENINDSATQGYVHLNLGMTFNAMQDSSRAKASFLKAIQIARSLGIKNVELYAYSAISNSYIYEKNYQEAYNSAMRANTLAKEMGDIGMEATTLSKAASQLANMNRFTEAEDLALKAIKIADASQQPLNIYQAYDIAGVVYKLEKKYNKAIPYFEKAFSALSSSDIYDSQTGESYFNLSECYEQTGDFKKALATYKTSAQIADSIRSKENIRKATEMNMNYEFDKKREIEKAQQQKKDEVAKTRQTALVTGLLLAFITALVAFYAFYNKRKANATLQQQKVQIENALSELKITQDQLIQSEKMASLGELTAGIAHEIQNPLNFVNNFSDINKELILELKDEIGNGNYNEVRNIANSLEENEIKINHHGKRADSIVKGMLQHSRANTGVKDPTDINALCDEYLRLSYHGLRAKDKSFNAKMDIDFDPFIGKPKLVAQDIGRVILNIINNAFYAVHDKKKQLDHARMQGQVVPNYEPTVFISTRKAGSNIEIVIADNGNGIPASLKKKIFQPFFTTKPTGQGTGLGLSLSYDIVKAHDGDISVEAEEGAGTTFIISLPA